MTKDQHLQEKRKEYLERKLARGRHTALILALPDTIKDEIEQRILQVYSENIPVLEDFEFMERVGDRESKRYDRGHQE